MQAGFFSTDMIGNFMIHIREMFKTILKTDYSSTHVVFILSFFLCSFYNITLWGKIFSIYPSTPGNLLFLASIAICFYTITSIFISIFDFPHILKPVAIFLILSASIVAYFMDSYHVIIDQDMLINTAQTDAKEILDLLNLKFFTYIIFLGLLPSCLLLFVRIQRRPLLGHLATIGKRFSILLILMTLSMIPFSRSWASFLREHKNVRGYANPEYLVYSLGKLATKRLSATPGPLQPLGLDAHTRPSKTNRTLVIMVVGEAARTDHFSLNGYARNTNPLLAQTKTISFTNMFSNGTSTANSVPCMFSMLDHKTFSESKVKSSENLLDVLTHAGTHVFWRDNNSDSKGIATRVDYENFKATSRNQAEGEEPRDEQMLIGLQDYIDKHQNGDIFIVLHQMGSHGPAYYKRYPSTFERFTPVKRTNELGTCTPQEIANAYDNSILYTDYFLSQVIKFLEKNENTFSAAMIYSSDHGESLGEKGLYLHGMPYFIAPTEQKQVATLFWFSKSFGEDIQNRFQKASHLQLTHSSLFHTILGIFEIDSMVYRQELDIARIIDHTNPIKK